MSLFSKNSNDLDHAVEDVLGDIPDPSLVDAAAARVWERLSRDGASHRLETAAPATPHTFTGPVKGCEDFQSLIPAYLAGSLPPARALLVEDHTRSCIACRRALRDARKGATPADTVVTPQASRLSPGLRRGLLTSLAAVLVFGLGLGMVYLFQQMPWSGAPQARVESIEGSLFQVSGADIRPVAAGERFGAGVEVRTAKGSHAFVRLGDGSLVEMNERSGLSYAARRSGTTIQLGQGRILVQAAKQHGTHLYVATSDCLVSVTGTIFAVNSGTKGSRVSVVEGEVRVKQASRDSILHPGDQVATHASMTAIPVRQEIAWSKDAAQYDALLAKLTQLGKDLDADVARPGLRTSTRLLDLAPQETLVYVALPNLAQNLAQTQQKLEERLASDSTLNQWWGQAFGSGQDSERFHDVITKIGDLGKNLGDEVAVAVTSDGPVVLTEVTNPAAFRAALEQEAAEENTKAGKTVLQIVDSPTVPTAAPSGDGHTLLLWVKDDLFVATPNAALLGRMGSILEHPEANPFRQAAFHNRVAESYQEGAGWLFAGDFKKLFAAHAQNGVGSVGSHAEALGILDFQDVVINRREGTGRTATVAAVNFDRPRRGIPSWLAAPGPMRSLEFISPDANFASVFVVKNPVNLLDDLLTAVPELSADLDKLQAEHGINLRDFAAPLGGEIALALDGPLLPKPSWKLVMEVYDPRALESSLEQLAVRLNDQLRAAGKPGITLTHQTTGGQTYYTLASAAQTYEVDYLFTDGYLVMAPSRALLDRALSQRASGFTLASSAKFRSLLPSDQQVNFSALVYQNLAPALGPLAGVLDKAQQGNNPTSPNTSQGGHPSIAHLLAGAGPSLTYAYAQENRILFASNSENGPLGLNLGTLASLRGLIGAAGMHHGAAEEAH